MPGLSLPPASPGGSSWPPDPYTQRLPPWRFGHPPQAAGPGWQDASSFGERAGTPLWPNPHKQQPEVPLPPVPSQPPALAPGHSHSFIMPMSTQRLSRQAWQWRRLSLVMRQSPLKGQVNSAFRFMLRLPREDTPSTGSPTFQLPSPGCCDSRNLPTRPQMYISPQRTGPPAPPTVVAVPSSSLSALLPSLFHLLLQHTTPHLLVNHTGNI